MVRAGASATTLARLVLLYQNGGVAMKYGSISSRQCARCKKIGTAPLPTGICASCTEWQKHNPGKQIKVPAITGRKTS